MLSSDVAHVGVAPAPRTTESMDDVNKKALRRLMHIMTRFRLVRHTMPVHLIETLLRVALDEGKSVKEYAEASAVSTSVMSRHLIDISTAFRNGDAGLGLIETRISDHSLREKQVYLTPKGRKTVNEVVQMLLHGSVDKEM